MTVSTHIPKTVSAEASLARSFAAVGGVLLLALVVQGWLVARTPISSIDSVRFISIAQSIENQGIRSVLLSDREQPLFPLVVCGVQHTLGWLGVDRTEIWMRSVQIASVLGLLLAAPAIYLVARRVAGHTAAVVGTLVFVLLPEVARLGPDGIADTWQLALVAWAVVLFLKGERGERRGERFFLVGGGALVALALLVRIEAAVVIGAMLLSMLLVQHKMIFIAGTKNTACFILGLGLVLAPYLWACNVSQPSQAISRLLGRAASRETDRAIVNETPPLRADTTKQTTLAADIPSLTAFSAKEPGTSIRHRGFFPAVVKVAEETADLFGYWIGFFALAGAVILTRQRKTFTTFDRFTWLLFGLLLAVVTWFTAKEGYLTARHLLLLLVPSISSIGIGIVATSDWFHNRFTSNQEKPLPSRLSSLPFIALLLLVMALQLAPHRAHRSVYREAGRWLANQSQETTTANAVFDTRGWTSLFSTMPTYQAAEAKKAFADPRLQYVVVMEEELLSSSDRSQTLRTLLDRRATRVAQFTSPKARRTTDSLIVYRLKNFPINQTASCKVLAERERELYR